MDGQMESWNEREGTKEASVSHSSLPVGPMPMRSSTRHNAVPMLRDGSDAGSTNGQQCGALSCDASASNCKRNSHLPFPRRS